MKISLDCIPCFIRQALDAARLVTPDEEMHRALLRDVLKWSSEIDLNQPPIILAQRIHRHIRKITGIEDPYFTAKSRFNDLAMNMIPELSDKISNSSDPLMLAVRLAIAGNVIDMGVNSTITENDIRLSVNRSLTECFQANEQEFRNAVSQAGSILYLADNAGEIVFDRLLIEQLPVDKVTLAVRGAPILNDATRTDALTAGLDKMVRIIDNGSDAPGTLLNDCSEEFLRHYHDADMIIAKGQGNYESLSDDEAREIFFLFKVKCPVISDHIGYPLGNYILARSHESQTVLKAS
ncbi:MAG: DUF89 family protein [Gammaproteobacteria bacterium]|nr:DUF89 family protein [Gammaproteobacteria bacterium]